MTSSRPSSGVLRRSLRESDTNLDSLVFLRIIRRPWRGGCSSSNEMRSASATAQDERRRPTAAEISRRLRNVRALGHRFLIPAREYHARLPVGCIRSDGQLADGFVPGSPGHVDDDSAVQLDRFVVEHHSAAAVDDVIEFVGPLMIVELGVVDLDVVNLGGGSVVLFDQRAGSGRRSLPRG